MPHPIGEPADEAAAMLQPYIDGIIRRINVDEFTTAEFIEALQLDGLARAVFDEVLRRWPEPDETMARMVIHGQVVPGLLRESSLVEWAGYAYGEQDPYAVPAWWRKVETG